MTRAIAMAAALALGGCSAGGALSLLTGGGPNVAANTQLGKTNSQTIGESRVTEQIAPVIRDSAFEHLDARQSSDENRVKADHVQTVVVNEVPVWIILVALAGWMLPTPAAIAGSISSAVKRRLS